MKLNFKSLVTLCLISGAVCGSFAQNVQTWPVPSGLTSLSVVVHASPNGRYLACSGYNYDTQQWMDFRASSASVTSWTSLNGGASHGSLQIRDIADDGTVLLSNTYDVATQTMDGSVQWYPSSNYGYSAYLTPQGVLISQGWSPANLGFLSTTTFNPLPQVGMVGDTYPAGMATNGSIAGRTYGDNSVNYAIEPWVRTSSGYTVLPTPVGGFQAEAFAISPNGKFVAGVCTPYPGVRQEGVIRWNSQGEQLSYTPAALNNNWDVRGVDDYGNAVVQSFTLGIGGLFDGHTLRTPHLNAWWYQVWGVTPQGNLYGLMGGKTGISLWRENPRYRG